MSVAILVSVSICGCLWLGCVDVGVGVWVCKRPFINCIAIFQDSRGVWHFHPTTRNEAVDESGKGNLASFLYLQIVELLTKLLLDFASHIVPSKLF